jgi:hypothetical protein
VLADKPKMSANAGGENSGTPSAEYVVLGSYSTTCAALRTSGMKVIASSKAFAWMKNLFVGCGCDKVLTKFFLSFFLFIILSWKAV